MTLLPPGVKVHLAFGYTDMRKGIDGLAMLFQGVLRQDPLRGVGDNRCPPLAANKRHLRSGLVGSKPHA